MEREITTAKKRGINISCEYCGKQVYKTITNYKRHKHHYCSNECQHKKQHEDCYEERACEICGITFEVRKKQIQRFCSVACQNTWQANQTGDKNARYKRIKICCDNCGKEVEIIPANYKRFQRHFCSDSCRKIWYANVWSQTSEWREKSRRRAVQILPKSAVTDTRPQKCVNNILEEAGIKYVNEYSVKYYSVDNYLPDYNLMIEVMGDFWHCNPIVYEKPICRIQRERLQKDRAKHTYILNQYRIQVLYLWEKDIIERPRLCAALIERYANLSGVLPYYHSYNWDMDDNILRPKVSITPEYKAFKLEGVAS